MPQAVFTADRSKVIVIGGGLAGLAAASVLAPRGFEVTLLESRPRLGGRASSIVDRETGQTIDNCQHVTMGCCTAFRHFCETTGCVDLFETQMTLHFVEPPSTGRSPRIVPFRGIPLPAPAHLSFALARMPWFSLSEKRAIARGLRALSRDRSCEVRDSRESFSEWLTRHGQPEVVQTRFWHTVLVSALSETLDRISVRHARKVFVDGFLSNRHGWKVSIPTAPLGEIYDERIARSLREAGVDVRTSAGVKEIILDGQVAKSASMRDGTALTGDEFVLAVPHWLCSSMLPDEVLSRSVVRRSEAPSPGLRPLSSPPGSRDGSDAGSLAIAENTPDSAPAPSSPVEGEGRGEGASANSLSEALDRIETAPIASAHFWFDRPLTDLPHATLLDRTSQWFFNRGQDADGRHYCQVVISAAGELAVRSEAAILEEVEAELKAVWPDSRDAKRLYGRVITEHRAVFAPLPRVDDLRPPQQTSIENLQLAGDWTQTGWPSTMEGAVRSGFLAAQNILNRHGKAFELPTELPQSLLYRGFFA